MRRHVNTGDTGMCKEGPRGVFWLVEDELIIAKYEEGITEGLSKAGNNYNQRDVIKAITIIPEEE